MCRRCWCVARGDITFTQVSDWFIRNIFTFPCDNQPQSLPPAFIMLHVTRGWGGKMKEALKIFPISFTLTKSQTKRQGEWWQRFFSSCLEPLTESSCGIIVLNQQINGYHTHLHSECVRVCVVCVCVCVCVCLCCISIDWRLGALLLTKWMLH